MLDSDVAMFANFMMTNREAMVKPITLISHLYHTEAPFLVWPTLIRRDNKTVAKEIHWKGRDLTEGPDWGGWTECGVIWNNASAYMSTVPHSAGQSRIFNRCPAKWDRCPAFLENGIFFFLFPIMLHFCLATQQSDKLRIKIGSKFARRQTTDLL